MKQKSWSLPRASGVAFFEHNLNMYNLTKLKILVIGPDASGKTTVVNYLSQKANVLDAPYRPTNSVRIVEHETEVDNRLVSIEFWDVAGTQVPIQATSKTIEFGQAS